MFAGSSIEIIYYAHLKTVHVWVSPYAPNVDQLRLFSSNGSEHIYATNFSVSTGMLTISHMGGGRLPPISSFDPVIENIQYRYFDNVR